MFEKRMVASFILLLVILVFAPIRQAQTKSQVDEYEIASRGEKLSDEEAQKLEGKLKADPSNSESHIMLLGYYFLKRFSSESARSRRRSHVLWIIENRPESMIAGKPEAYFDSVIEL